MIRGTFVCATATFFLFVFANKPDQRGLVTLACGAMGFFAFAVLPIALELGVETTYPVNEATSAGFLWIAGQIFGIIFILLMECVLRCLQRFRSRWCCYL
jgi:hypothetical protein